MKKLLFGIAALAMFATGSCKKTEGGPSNSWTVGANTFSAVAVEANPSSFGHSYVARDGNTSDPHVIIFFFSGNAKLEVKAPSAGTYKVVRSAKAPDEVSFSATGTTPSTPYWSTGDDNISATVSVIADKVRITMPKAWAAGGGPDSVQVSADIMQD